VSITDLDLPPSWVAVTLGQVIDYGAAEKAEPEEIAPETWVLELEDIERDSSRVLQRIPFSVRRSKSTKNRFSRGDVLYGKLRPYLNKVVYADAPGVCTTEIVPIKPGSALAGRYLFYWLRHPEFLRYVTEISHGVNMPRLGTEAGLKAPLVLAPLHEQQRIADKLDTVLARVDACRDRLARVAPLLKRFRQSVLAAATSGRLTAVAPGGYRAVPLSGLLQEPLRNGKSVVDGTGVRVLRLSSLGEKEVKLDESKRGDWGGIDVGRYFIHAGDFLVARGSGSRELVGRGALVSTEPEEPVAFPDTMIRVRPDLTSLNPHYLRAIWDGREVRSQIETSARTTAGIYKISQTDLESLKVPLPPLDEQTEIVRRVEVLFAFADRLEVRLAQAHTAVDRLTPSLLAQAFRGELVPQHPEDEPAAELLKRLATQHETASARPRRKRATA